MRLRRRWASFWHTIYVLPGHEQNALLLRHERCHLERIESKWRLLFLIKYLYWMRRHGYYMSPYEIEARAAESKTPHDRARAKAIRTADA